MQLIKHGTRDKELVSLFLFFFSSALNQPTDVDYSLQQLTVPGRVLVGEGVLTKMCRKRAKPRQFFLFNDILVYGNIVISKKKYNKQHIIPLEEVELQGLEDSGREYKWEFKSIAIR